MLVWVLAALTWPAFAVPHLQIETERRAPVDSKTEYREGLLRLNGVAHEVKIRGRGNSSWYLKKKPYRLKLEHKAALLGLPADKDWVLLANHSDKTLMRALLAFELGRRFGMTDVPRAQTVELDLNGAPQGTYLLTEQVKASPARVPLRDGGWLVELDHRKDDVPRFETARAIPYTIKELGGRRQSRAAQIQNEMQEAEDALYGESFRDPSTGYARHLDLDSFVAYYLINEIFKNQDAAGFASIFLYKTGPQAKIKMGPLWDFDISLGNIDYSEAKSPEGFWMREHSPWFKRLFEDANFEARVRAKWRARQDLGSDLNSLMALIDHYAAELNETQALNFTVWPILNEYVWPNRVITGSYAGEVTAMKAWLTLRMRWLATQYD